MSENQEPSSPEAAAEAQKANCIFCKIISGEVASHKVYEDDTILSILDIYPSIKGHTLIFPKKHIPILPLTPPDIFKHLFGNLKYFARAVRRGVPSEKINIYMANGGAAGQQNPHLLVHVVPRDSGDGLANFEIPEKDIPQADIKDVLKTNLARMMGGHLQKENKSLAPIPKPNKEQLAQMLEQNPYVKKLIIDDPEAFKSELEKNDQLKVLFQGIDVTKLSEKLKAYDAEGEESVSEQPQLKSQAENVPVQNTPTQSAVQPMPIQPTPVPQESVPVPVPQEPVQVEPKSEPILSPVPVKERGFNPGSSLEDLSAGPNIADVEDEMQSEVESEVDNGINNEVETEDNNKKKDGKAFLDKIGDLFK